MLLNIVSPSLWNSRLNWLLIQLPAFRRVLEFNEPISMVAIPEFNKFLVHCEMALYSYPLDMIVRAFRGDATFNDLDNSMERLAGTHGAVWFLKTGSVAGRTLGT
jgi:hypothetical protein